jgi:DUF4097 and DUF4098 domain-containing protein YvlB
MAQKTLPAISDKPAISLKALRDLSLEGWDRQEVSIKSRNEQSMMVQLMGEVLQITCMEDAELNIPMGSVINIDKVGGDGEFRNLSGILNIQSINGDAAFREITAPIVVQYVGGNLEIDQTSSTQIDKIGGDAVCNSLSGPLSIRQVGGDAKLTDLAACQIDKISGDCQVENVHGDLTIQKTGGDFTCKNGQGNLAASSISGDFVIGSIQGNIVVTHIGGDCEASDFQGGITIATTSGDVTASHIEGSLKVDRVGGDADLQDISAVTRIKAGGDIKAGLASGSCMDCNLQAGGDVSVHLIPNAQANLQVTSNGQNIVIEVGDQHLRLNQRTYQMSMGSVLPEQTKATDLVFTAGGDVSISDKAGQGDGATGNPGENRFDPFKGHFGPDFTGINFNPFDAEKFAANIHQTVSRQVEQASRMVEQRVRDAMKQVENVQAPDFSQFGRPPFAPGNPTPPIPPTPVAPVINPEKVGVTDEERLLILEMVRDQKISIDEAEKLLEAIEKQGS